MKRKLMSIMLAAVMLFGVIPFGSVAANAQNEPQANIIGSVSVNVIAPQAGTSSADVKPQIEITCEGCSLASALWLYGLNMYTSDEPVFDFEEGKTYYMYVMLKADSDLEFAKSSEQATGIDEGFDYFKGCTVTGGELKFAASRKLNDGEYLRLKIAVTAVAKAEPSSIPAVYFTFTPPEVGTKVEITKSGEELKQTPAPEVTYASDDDRYYITARMWYENGNEDGGSGYIETSFTFEEDSKYYARVELKARDGYCFNEKTEVDVENAYVSEYSITTSEDESSMLITFYFETESSPISASYFAVWMCDVEHTPNKGGSVTIEYVAPDGSIPADSGKNWNSSTNQTVPVGTLVTLSAKPDEGYRFKGWYQANIDRADANDPYYFEEALISKAKTYSFTDNPIGENKAPYICAVFEEGEDREVDQIQVWVGNTTGEGAAKDAGGKVAVKYEITGENLYNLESKSGTDFVYGEIVPFYKGDEITAYAQADDGCYFVGWYHVNIEWGPGEGKAYQGDVISTEISFTYKPGETVLEGDTEPLRYICAVFEKGEKPSDSDIPTDTDKPMYGDVNCDGKISMEDVTSLQKIIANLATYESFGEMSKKNADCDFDGNGTMIDVTLIQKYLAKLITSFEPAK